MPKIDHNTKEKILTAAEKVFHLHGFKGTRTSSIAEEAGISRTMLHYYYSTKEELFQEVLQKTVGVVINHLNRLFGQEQELEKVIENLIEVICDILEEKPHLPSFIINILNEMPALFFMIPASEQDNLPTRLDLLLNEGKKTGKIDAEINGENLLLNIYGLCIIPYLGAPYIKVKENRSEEAMKTFIRERRKKILNFILKGLKG